MQLYPMTLEVGVNEVVLRPLEAGDREGLLAFARRLPEHDLLFLRRDITDPSEVQAWIEESTAGELVTLLAVGGSEVAGYVVVDRSRLAWSRHVAELRVLLDPAWRGKSLGRRMTTEAFRVAASMGVEKMVAQMTVDQTGAVTIFQNFGFENEAILERHVKDRAGRTYDLLVLRRWVDAEEAAILLEQEDSGAS